MDHEKIIRIVDDILKLKKFKFVYRPTLERIVTQIASDNSLDVVEDKSKQLVHHVWGSSWKTFRREYLYELIDVAFSAIDVFDRESQLTKALSLHASTAQRASYLFDFYQHVFLNIGHISSLSDYGCGLNPLTLPWMKIHARVDYHPRDVDLSAIEVANYFFHHGEYPYHAIAGDLLNRDYVKSDAAFLFGVLPILEQQEKGSSVRVINELPSRWIVITLPARLYGMDDKSTPNLYDDWFTQTFGTIYTKIVKIQTHHELLCIIDKHPA
ncbi:hypothetical protein HGA91_05265 [candidate division WWE3 bacterium]|nr:hypothetical protein [candidate division WWE3 bacterium]